MSTGAEGGVKKGPGAKLVWIMAGIGLGLVLLSKLFGSSDEPRTSVEKAPTPIEVGSGKINDIGGQDKDAALVQFSKKLEAMTARMDRDNKNRDEERKKEESERRKLQQQNEASTRALADAIAKLQTDLVDKTYRGIADADTTAPQLPATPNLIPPTDGLNFDGDFNLGPATLPSPGQPTPSSPYGPNYTVLRPQMQQNTFQGKSGGGAGSQAESDLFNEMAAPDVNAFDRAATRTSNNTQATLDEMNGRPRSAPQQEPQAKPAVQAINGQGNAEEYEIEAFSFVEVTTLHGQACPIGANSPTSSSDDQAQAKPIVLPARGIWHGPNGVERDLGTIHLMGLCSGRRTSSSNTGRALIRVEQMSYWDAEGGSQMVPAVGYIVDTRDNEADVYGKLDKASGRTLALQSAAAAAAAYASTLSAAEFTNSSSVQNGTSTVTSQLTGSEAQAALATGIGAAFKDIADRFKAEANAIMDTIQVEPGIKLQFITEQPIRVKKAMEPLDIDAKMYDILI
ncbi:conjugal transfer protein TraB [Pseudomonas aeruginosa]